jgi:uncharacterized protein YigA (DUF484 family)
MGALLWLDELSGSAGEAPLASKLIRHGESFSGVLRPEEMQAVFGTDATEGSAALVAIRSGGDDIGVLGVGSHDTQRYRAEDGTLFLEYLAEVIGQLPGSH